MTPAGYYSVPFAGGHGLRLWYEPPPEQKYYATYKTHGGLLPLRLAQNMPYPVHTAFARFYSSRTSKLHFVNDVHTDADQRIRFVRISCTVTAVKLAII